MKNSFSVKNNIIQNIFVYLCAILATVLSLTYAITLKLKPKDYEIFSIFVSEYNIELKSFKEELQNVLGNQIIEPNIYHVNPDSTYYYQTYTSQGYNSDLLILSENVIYDNDVKAFAEIPSKFINANDYLIESAHKGLKVFDGNNGVWSNYINYQNKNYYLFINPDSVHLKGIKENGKTESVLTILEDICDEKN